MRDLVYPPIVVAAKLGLRLLGQQVDLAGAENVPRHGGVVLALNHLGYLDPVYGGLAADPSRRLVRFLSKRELFEHRWIGPVMRGVHHIEVDRAEGGRSLETAVEYLRAGEAVGIFPEATISRSMELKEFKTGAVRIAAAAGVPVVPVVLWGTQRVLTKDHPRDLTRGRTVTIRVGAPRRYAATDPVADTADLRAVMGRMLEEAIAAHPADEQPPGSWWLPARFGGSAPTPEEAARLDAEEKARRAARREARRG
ncbi:lysophospholipid acyltransferase family protein [Phycicoccus sp. M110.8]|uniref:lysophospholipid acyltransferase family protein n=1 Tax=Phycicoccus sp. M110.8 TaxID=3075433 RepID=UPI0028FD86E2|nr:lysophospholipid acyltransferase family protein [Phycicoccus sp. M110.8]MDU0312746.1 lysophospholipid acyltransferase family protein [Phycicoccus sp. M110.8]